MDSNQFLLIPIVLFTISSALFSASETAFFSLPRAWVKSAENSPFAHIRLIAKLLITPQDLLVTIFILNTVVNILVQNSVSAYIGENGSFVAKIFIPFFLLLFLGEVFPQQLGMVKNRTLAESFAPILDKLNRWIAPLRVGVMKVTLPLSRILFAFLQRDRLLGQEEIEHVLSSSQERGVIYPEEVELASGYLDLKESLVRDVQLPKEDMEGYDTHEPLTKLSHLLSEGGHKEVPIYQRNWDHLLGTLSVNTYLQIRDKLKTSQDIKKFVEKPFFIPEVAPARVLLEELLKKGKTTAFCIDEFGGLAGTCLLEDLVEVVFGTLGSSVQEELDYQVVSPTAIIADGTMDLDELESFFKITLRGESTSQSVGGWLIDEIGDIPKIGLLFEKGGIEFQVVSAEPHRVKKVFIKRREPK